MSQEPRRRYVDFRPNRSRDNLALALAAASHQCSPIMSDLKEIQKQIASAMLVDQFALRRSIRSIQNAQKAKKPFDRSLEKLTARLEKSVRLREQRAQSVPKITYPADLPVAGRKDEIAAAIDKHQVIVVCGETGSGKSTQLPKIALELGRGIAGTIGHTQPRRIAARSIATRLAEELKCEVSKQVGYRIRFNDASGPQTLIRLMTDGIMLAETQSDRFLEQYDTIIVDEAHERSLNIDFLLGYLKRLLPKRPDLRIIITSATIDAERFAEHFSTNGKPAPVILVKGRTYPVDLQYRPLEHGTNEDGETIERDWLDAVVDATHELASNDNGHMLVFLPTERDIREVDKRLSGQRYPGDSPKLPTQIVPLFGRLSMADQAKVFQTYQHRRIVLATNVAESSLTVPGINYVIDTGTARISRYSARSRMQRLPVEAVSQASARQRAGRCGRIGPGVCVRLYSEEDYNGREAFTAPEIQRTNLAAVILRTMNLKLGRLDEFPFLDPPKPTSVREGYKTLEELGAIEVPDESRGGASDDYRLTTIGRQMARLPVDPRISRMILAAIDEHAVVEVMVIASALEIQDPRERPIDKQQAADEAHRQFQHEDSDFLTLLNLWDAWFDNKKKLSGGQLKKWCKKNFLSWMRMREWVDVHRQLKDLLADSGDDKLKKAAARHPVKDRKNDFAAIHRSIMTGLLANLGYRSADREYTGAGGNKLTLWPGSALSKKKPKWFVAGELVETSQRFARTLAKIQPEWIEPLAEHLVKREYSEPHWDSKAGNVMCFEKVSLWGLPIVPRRKTLFFKVDPVKAREMLIQYGLVELGLLYGKTEGEADSEYEDEEKELMLGRRTRITPGRVNTPSVTARPDASAPAYRSDAANRKGWGKEFPFLQHNVRVLAEIKELQARTRRHDLLPNEESLFEIYDKQVPADIGERTLLKRWFQRTTKNNPGLLQFDLKMFTDDSDADSESAEFPATVAMGSMKLPLSYQLDPGRDADGVTLSVPAEGLAQLRAAQLEWLIPGLLEQKVTELIRALPKHLRRKFVPAPDTAKLIAGKLPFGQGNLLNAMAEQLSVIAGEPVKVADFNVVSLPDHLRMNVRVVDDKGKPVTEGRDLVRLRQSLLEVAPEKAAQQKTSAEEKQWHRKGFTGWDFADVPAQLNIKRAGMSLTMFPAIRDDENSVGLTLCQTAADSTAVHRRGLRRLTLMLDAKRIRRQIEHLPEIQKIRLLASSIRGLKVEAELQLLLVERAYLSAKELPRTAAQFDTFLEQGRKRIGVVVQELVQLIPNLFRQYHEARAAIENAAGAGRDAVLKDMKTQLNALVCERFLKETPWPWLIQIPRYFQCMRLRIDRLKSGGLKTEQKLSAEYSEFEHRYLERRQQHTTQQISDPMLDHYRWMLEEFRVSLFAQKLGTAITVSQKKLNEHWDRVQ